MNPEESKTEAAAAESEAKRARMAVDPEPQVDDLQLLHLQSTVMLCHYTLRRLKGEAEMKYSSDFREKGESLVEALREAKKEVSALRVARSQGLMFSEIAKHTRCLVEAHQQAQQVLQLTGDLIAALLALDLAPAAAPAAKPAP